MINIEDHFPENSQPVVGKSSLSGNQKFDFKQLLSDARRLSNDLGVEIGSVILSYGWQTKDWEIAMSVLKTLEPNTNEPATINTYFKKYIDLKNLDQDTQDYLKRLDIFYGIVFMKIFSDFS